MAINITRHPFSFRGDAPMDEIYSPLPCTIERPAVSALQRLGDSAGIQFNIDRTPFYNPVDSQRALLWAAQFGKQEDLAEVLA